MGDHRLGSGLVHVPPRVQGRRVPLLVVAHGDGFTGPRLARALGVSDAADRAGLIVLYPTARGGSWARRSEGAVWDRVRALARAGCVDPRRVSAAGFSSGAAMVARLACLAHGRVASVVTIAGYYRDRAACAAGPASVLAIHGTGDRTIPYRVSGVEGWLRAWARADRCAPAPAASRPARGVTRVAWRGCAGGRVVQELRLAGAGHGWPGEPVLAGPGAAAPLDATAELFRFLG